MYLGGHGKKNWANRRGERKLFGLLGMCMKKSENRTLGGDRDQSIHGTEGSKIEVQGGGSR